MGMAEMIAEVVKAYIDNMPLKEIETKIKDIAITYHTDNTVTVDIYLQNSFIIIYLEFNDIPTFGINGNYIGKVIEEITNYFKILGFKELS